MGKTYIDDGSVAQGCPVETLLRVPDVVGAVALHPFHRVPDPLHSEPLLLPFAVLGHESEHGVFPILGVQPESQPETALGRLIARAPFLKCGDHLGVRRAAVFGVVLDEPPETGDTGGDGGCRRVGHEARSRLGEDVVGHCLADEAAQTFLGQANLGGEISVGDFSIERHSGEDIPVGKNGEGEVIGREL